MCSRWPSRADDLGALRRGWADPGGRRVPAPRHSAGCWLPDLVMPRLPGVLGGEPVAHHLRRGSGVADLRTGRAERVDARRHQPPGARPRRAGTAPIWARAGGDQQADPPGSRQAWRLDHRASQAVRLVQLAPQGVWAAHLATRAAPSSPRSPPPTSPQRFFLDAGPDMHSRPPSRTSARSRCRLDPSGARSARAHQHSRPASGRAEPVARLMAPPAAAERRLAPRHRAAAPDPSAPTAPMHDPPRCTGSAPLIGRPPPLTHPAPPPGEGRGADFALVLELEEEAVPARAGELRSRTRSGARGCVSGWVWRYARSPSRSATRCPFAPRYPARPSPAARRGGRRRRRGLRRLRAEPRSRRRSWRWRTAPAGAARRTGRPRPGRRRASGWRPRA